MTKRFVTHASFTIERTLEAAPARVFAAFANPKEKARWFVGPDEWRVSEFEMDFRVGGRDINAGGPEGEAIHKFESLYMDIVPNERIVFAYDMHIGDRRISVSLTTVEFKEADPGTKLIFTEQGAFLDGYDDAGSREGGTRELLNNLEASLRPIA